MSVSRSTPSPSSTHPSVDCQRAPSTDSPLFVSCCNAISSIRLMTRRLTRICSIHSSNSTSTIINCNVRQQIRFLFENTPLQKCPRADCRVCATCTNSICATMASHSCQRKRSTSGRAKISSLSSTSATTNSPTSRSALAAQRFSVFVRRLHLQHSSSLQSTHQPRRVVVERELLHADPLGGIKRAETATDQLEPGLQQHYSGYFDTEGLLGDSTTERFHSHNLWRV